MQIKTTYLIFLQGLLMMFFLLVTSWFNRFSADDYLFIGELSNHSFPEIYQKLYLTWNGRWAYNFTILFFLQFYDTPHFLFFFNVLSIALLLGSIYALFYQLNKQFKTDFENKEILNYTLIFCGVFFFYTHLTGQSWFWISAALAYLWSSIFFLWGLSAFIKKQTDVWDYIIVTISGCYIGGSNEILSIITILLIVFSIRVKENYGIKMLSLVTLFVSFATNYFSIGTAIRDGLTPNLPFTDLILYVGYGSFKYIFLDGYKTILPAIVFALPFFYLGKTVGINFHRKYKLKKELVNTVLFVVAVVVVNQFVVIYALGGLAPDRSTITTSLLGSLAIVRFMFLCGNQFKKSTINLKPIFLSIVGLMVVFNVLFLFIHKDYSQSVDMRMDYILASKNAVIEVDKLKNSGYLNSAEITNDTTHFLNQHLKYGLGISQQIVLRDN
ncbi:MAG: DUF6056 family protein [Flavobacteriales bacterium]